MAAPATTADLRALLERSGLLGHDRLEIAFANARDSEAVFRRLVDDRLLTPFQADQLRKGRAESFFITDKYKVLDYIGAGGMGKVYLCEHLLLQRLVAIKLLQLTAGAGSESARAFDRFYREARAVAALNDPNIIRVFDVDRVGGSPFMIMEYADGSNLHEVVSRHGTLSPARAADYVRQAALGLQHAFEIGLIHRDIKPGNLILDRGGTVKLLDLGLARFLDDPTRNHGITEKYDKHVVLGTVDFMAPEQAFDPDSVDIRSDIYGLGCSFYYLITGQAPFAGRTVSEKMHAHKSQAPAPVSEICPRMEPGLLAVLEKMMAKEAADRYQTPAEIVVALTEWTREPVPPPPAHEMPEHAASFYRIGLSPLPGHATGPASTPNPIYQQETSRTPKPGTWALPTFLAPTPLPGTHAPSTGEAQPVRIIEPPPSVSRARSTIRRRRRLVRLAELLLFVLAAGGVGWLASREWMQAGRQAQTTPAAPVPPAPALKEPATKPFTGPILNSGGATFVSPVMQRWASVYEQAHGVRVDYQANSFDKGVQGALDRVYMFGCTNVPLTDEQLSSARGEVIHVPLVLGAVVVAYNLPDVAERLRFTGPALADIYLGKIKRWNDPAIAISNPDVKLPDLPIVVVHQGKTGTTFIWTEYLSKVSADWKAKVGTNADVVWPTGTAVNGNNGVAAEVSRQVGAIGYLEQSHALENNLATALVKNLSGKYVAPSSDSVTAAAVAMLRTIPDDLRFSLTHAPGESAYPIAGSAWAILYVDQTDRSTGKDLIAFLRWATHEGQAFASDLKFAPLPPELVKKIDERLAKVRVR